MVNCDVGKIQGMRMDTLDWKLNSQSESIFRFNFGDLVWDATIVVSRYPKQCRNLLR